MATANADSQRHFVAEIRQNPTNRILLDRLPALKLPDAWLVAGCLFQTIWNLNSGRVPTTGIKDYDLFYFDASDLSTKAEAVVAARVLACCHDLGVTVEAKNQARVHTWYSDYFGFAYPALADSRAGIDRFLVLCTCVGLSLDATESEPSLYAPNGLFDLYRGVLRPNPLCDHRPLFLAKAGSYRERWNWLQVIED